MFENFLQNGNVLSVFLMVYAGNVVIEALRADKNDINAPLILKHSLSALFMFCAIPCFIWPAIYIGIFDGWLSGIIAWIGLQLIGAIGTVVLGIRGRYIGLHFVLACIFYPVGYYLSLSNLG